MPGVQELLVIGVVALLVVGPDRLPGLARDAGRLLARLRQETSRATADLREAVGVEDLDDDLRALTREPTLEHGDDHAHTAWRR